MNLPPVLVLLGVVGCAGAAAGGAPVAVDAPVAPPVGLGVVTPDVAAPSPLSDVRAPVQVRVQGPPVAPKAGSTLAVDWAVEMATAFPAPLTVKVRAPHGVEVTGDVSATILPEPGTKRGRVFVRVREVPKDDLVIVVDGASEAAGMHAEIPYRFGRPAPRVAQPPRADTPVVRDGVNLGRPVRMP